MAGRLAAPASRPDRHDAPAGTQAGSRAAVPPSHRLVLASLSALLLASSALAVAACGGGEPAGGAAGGSESGVPADCAEATEPRTLVPEVVRELPHDPTAFTQGLDEVDGVLYESTGGVGRSRLIALEVDTGAVLAERPVDPDVFAEGLTYVDGELVQLTWRDGVAFRWKPSGDPSQPPQPAGRWDYEGEGWGLTTLDDGILAMSDGSARITERDPGDFSVQRTWTLRRAGGGVDRLNELEWDGEHLWANRWQTDEVLGIDHRCHHVVAVVDASTLTERAREVAGDDGVDVLNGVAHVEGTDRYLVTGKLWPVMFEVRFVPA